MATDQEIRELTRLAAELVNRIDGLIDGTGDQLVGLAQRAKKNRQMIWMLALSLFLDVGLTIVMALGLVQLNQVTDRVDRQQQFTNKEVLCPLYQQFVNSDTVKNRELAIKNGVDVKARDEAFRVIHKSYDALNCRKP